MPPKVSFVIVNYNGAKCLHDCLSSVFGQTRIPDEVIVVDNHSDDGSASIAKDWPSPRLRLVELGSNAGYPAACNAGIGVTTGDLVAVLNNDIQLDPGWLETLLAHDHPEWGFWASRIAFAFDPDRIDSAGDGMAVVGAAYKRGHGHPLDWYEEEREVFGPCGAAALYRRELLLATGGFDEDLFLVHEDGDLSFRARLLGFRCLFVPEAKVVHQVNTSIGTLSETYVYYGHRNSETLFWKNMPGALLALYLPERLLFDLLCLLYFANEGRAKPFLRAKWDFFRSFPQVWRKRKSVQKSRRLGNRAIRRELDRNWLRHRRKVRRDG